jgi:RNA polymerase sigma factor (sigma-70 family)
MNEDEWVARAAAGDAPAFSSLVRLHQSSLRGFLRRLARGDHALADDVAQDTFLEAWRKIAQFRGEGSFAGWLHRIAYSRYLMTARRRKLEPLDPEWEPPAAETDPDLRLDLEKAMARLSLPERAALTLCYAQGYSNEEGAEILAMPLGTLKSHILRGREKLRRMLEIVS